MMETEGEYYDDWDDRIVEEPTIQEERNRKLATLGIDEKKDNSDTLKNKLKKIFKKFDS